MYVDTSALITFAHASDTYHALFRRLFADPPNPTTTTLVFHQQRFGPNFLDENWRPQGGLYVMLVAWYYHSKQLHNVLGNNY